MLICLPKAEAQLVVLEQRRDRGEDQRVEEQHSERLRRAREERAPAHVDEAREQVRGEEDHEEVLGKPAEEQRRPPRRAQEVHGRAAEHDPAVHREGEEHVGQVVEVPRRADPEPLEPDHGAGWARTAHERVTAQLDAACGPSPPPC